MPKPNARSIRSKQAAYLRYIASSDIETTSSELGLSTKTLMRFLKAAPETVLKSPESFTHVLSIYPQEMARERNRKLVPKLSGKRLGRTFRLMNTPQFVTKSGRVQYVNVDWYKRAVRYAQATRTKRRVTSPEGIVTYVPVQSGVDTHNRQSFARHQILSGLANENTRSLLAKYNAGTMSKVELERKINELWGNSDIAFNTFNMSRMPYDLQMQLTEAFPEPIP
jgi:hypothetical protein